MGGSSSSNDGSAFIAGNLAQNNPQLAALMQQYGQQGQTGSGTLPIGMAMHDGWHQWLQEHRRNADGGTPRPPGSPPGGVGHGGSTGGIGGIGSTGATGTMNWAFPQYSQTWAFTPPTPTPVITPPPFVPPAPKKK